MPAYQFGIAMVLVLFLAVLVGRNFALNGSKNTIVVYKTDTIFQNAKRAVPPATYLSDSDTKIVSPGYSGSYFADSIDYNIDDNSSNPSSAPSGIKNDPDLKQNTPGSKKIERPADIDRPIKGGSLLEDSSKWNRNLHGLL
jgi:hypothetical protein